MNIRIIRLYEGDDLASCPPTRIIGRVQYTGSLDERDPQLEQINDRVDELWREFQDTDDAMCGDMHFLDFLTENGPFKTLDDDAEITVS